MQLPDVAPATINEKIPEKLFSKYNFLNNLNIIFL